MWRGSGRVKNGNEPTAGVAAASNQADRGGLVGPSVRKRTAGTDELAKL